MINTNILVMAGGSIKKHAHNLYISMHRMSCRKSRNSPSVPMTIDNFLIKIKSFQLRVVSTIKVTNLYMFV